MGTGIIKVDTTGKSAAKGGAAILGQCRQSRNGKAEEWEDTDDLMAMQHTEHETEVEGEVRLAVMENTQ